ncbi:MAG: DUF2235 domain-containing protein [Maricaulaceae bacterium]
MEITGRAKMVKNLVICLDGTGNQIEENISNVLKLYRTLKKTNQSHVREKQIVFYDQGVGTLGLTHNWGRFKQKFLNTILGMGFGFGVDRNILKAYEFLVRYYQAGDRIYIFGYSRGAHTARALAGFLYKIGLLRPEQIHLSGSALTAYKHDEEALATHDGADDEYEGESENFRRVAKPLTVSIEFMGLWDTVSSVLVPNPKKFFIPPLTKEYPPHIHNNPAVKAFRQAAAIDERRRMFPLEPWEDGQLYFPNKYSKDEPEKQDAQQMWFAGSHGDVGGGYPRKDSGLSQHSLKWMITEAKIYKLKFISKRMIDYVSGDEAWSSNTKYLYPKAKVDAPIHNSMTFFWRIFEVFPKLAATRIWPNRKTLLGLYIPCSEPRFIHKDAKIHLSVFERRNRMKNYDPINLQGHKG